MLFMFMTGRDMLHEKNKEIDGMNKEFQRQIQVLVEDHKKEVDVSICRKMFISFVPSVEQRKKYEFPADEVEFMTFHTSVG